MTSFHEFGLADPINQSLAEQNYTTPTPIQAQTIPLALTGRDVVGIAQTGTGKTAAFALPILHRLAANRLPLQKKSCRVLVLSPTRELSAQILDSFKTYGRHLHISATLAIGGVSMGGQVRALLNGVDVLVATPGRLLDLVQSNALRLNSVEFLVLDEADRMLDMGFIHDIRKIVAKLPKERQTLFFSATMPQAIAELASNMLRDPARVSVTPESTTAERVDQRIVHLDKAAKLGVLAEMIKAEPIDRALVFTRTKHGADKVVRGLQKYGIRAEAIHGNKSQNQRTRALDAFRDGDVRIMVATDIAARGIDVDGVSHVFNYDLPNVSESYVHRIGRTARAGAAGIAISFCDHEELEYLRDIEKLIRQAIPATDRRTHQTPLAAAARSSQPHRQSNGPKGNGRNSGKGQQQRRNPRPHGQRDQRQDERQDHRNDQRQDARPDQRGDQRKDQRPAKHGRPQQHRNDGRAPQHRGDGRPQQRSEGRSQGQRGDARPQDGLSGLPFMQKQNRRP